MHNLKIFPYKMGSESAKELSNLLGAMRVRDAGRYTPKARQTVINWGSGKTPSWYNTAISRGVRILNNFNAVSVAGNKLTTFQVLQRAGVSIPEFTTSRSVAQSWLIAGDRVVERHSLRGSSGAGIRMVSLNDEDTEAALQNAPLYTKYIAKTAEYRVHIFKGEMIDYVQKKRMSSERRDDTYSPYISSMEHGWVFTRTEVPEIPSVTRLAKAAVAALGLDFGAVDIIMFDGRSYVLEVNTAPGLSENTVVKYGNALRRYMGVGNLSTEQTRAVLNQPTTAPATSTPVAAVRASVSRGELREMVQTGLWREQNDTVTLRLSRAAALDLEALLLSV